MKNKLKWMSLILAVCLFGILFLQTKGLYNTYRLTVSDLITVADKTLIQVLNDREKVVNRYNDSLLYSGIHNRYPHIFKFVADTTNIVRIIFANRSDPEYQGEIFSQANKLKRIAVVGKIEFYLSESEDLRDAKDSLLFANMIETIKKNSGGYDFSNKGGKDTRIINVNKKETIEITKNFVDSLKRNGYEFSNFSVHLVTMSIRGSQLLPNNMQRGATFGGGSVHLSYQKYIPYGFERYTTDIKRHVSFLIFSSSFVFIQMLKPILLSFTLFVITIIILILLFKIIRDQNRLSALKDDFIANMTHEFKTPIATISAAIEGMQNFNVLEDKEKTNRYLDTSKKELKHLNALVNKVLDMATFEKGEIDLIISKVNIAEQIDEIVDSERVKNTKAIAFNISIDENLKKINVDRLHFRNCLVNIIDNAIKYSDEPVKVDVNFTQDERFVFVSIKDNGIGISKLESAKIFNKFHRVSQGNIQNVRGTGLGLSYVKYIIEKHGGTLSVKSKLGVGSEFLIAIPKL